MHEKTDEEIAREVQTGTSEKFGMLVDRYENKMKRYAKKFLLNREDTDDLVQEVFMKAYVNIKSFDPSRRFSPWIYRIAHNEFVNAVRKKLSEKIFPFDFDLLFPHPIAAETADQTAHKRELRGMLDSHLESLPPKYREALVLYYYEDLDYKEIAEILQIPVSTVGIRLQRGKTILRKYMQDAGLSFS